MVDELPDEGSANRGLSDSKRARAPISDWRIADDTYENWIRSTETPALEGLLASSQSISAQKQGPLISIILPVFDTPEQLLRRTLDSVTGQHYRRWQLCIVDDASAAAHVRTMIEPYAREDSRIVLHRREENGGISLSSNDALGMARGDYVALLDHDDVLAPHALLLVAITALAHPDARLLYSDSDELDSTGRRCNPLFKPDWNYDLLLGQNYFNHLTVYDADLLRALWGFRPDFDASQDYDLALRAIERLDGAAIRHIPHVLYHWRVVENSVARANLGHACQVARQAVAEHLARTGQVGRVVPADRAVIFNRVVRPALQPEPPMTALLYGSDLQQLGSAAEQLKHSVDYSCLEVVEAFLPPDAEAAGEQLNALCLGAHTEFICLLHAGVSIEQADFLSILATHLARAGVGAVGAKLISPGGGLTCGGLVTGVGMHGIDFCCGAAELDSKGYFARLALEQEATAVHGLALALSTASLEAVGGISPGLCHPLLVGADICLKLAQRVERVIWTPRAIAHCPAQMLDLDGQGWPDDRQADRFEQLWRQQLGLDPFYNPNLSAQDGRFRL